MTTTTNTAANTTETACALQPGVTCAAVAPRDQMDIIDRAQLVGLDVYGAAIAGLIVIALFLRKARAIMSLAEETRDKTVAANQATERANATTIRAGMVVRS